MFTRAKQYSRRIIPFISLSGLGATASRTSGKRRRASRAVPASRRPLTAPASAKPPPGTAARVAPTGALLNVTDSGSVYGRRFNPAAVLIPADGRSRQPQLYRAAARDLRI